MPASKAHTIRRSSRVPIHLPVHVTSLEPNAPFSEVCETLVVSAHGCALRFPIPLDAGSALHLHSKEGRQITAYVVTCQPMGSEGDGWRLGARLDQPDNFWGLESCPNDWRPLAMPAPAFQPPPQRPSAVVLRKPQAPSRASQAVLDKIEEQLSEERLRGILAKLVRPLQAEINEVQQKLTRNARQNRFEVSLGQIPPQLEEKLWERLRQEVGSRVLEQAREQSAEILATAKATAEQKISGALAEFRNRLSGELHTVEQRSQALTKEITAAVRQQVHVGIEKLQQQTLDAEAQLTAQGEKVLTSVERRLADTHGVHRREIEQIQSAAAAQASQLQTELADLGQRIEALNEAVRRLQTDLDAHLDRMAGEIVSDARSQLERAVVAALKDLQVRGSNEVDTRLDQVCSHLRTIQNRIESSFSGSLGTQGEEAVQSVGQQFEELAQQCMERWRVALASDLKSVAKTLGQQLRGEFESEGGEDQVPTAG